MSFAKLLKRFTPTLRDQTKEIADTRRLIASSPRLKGKLNHRQLAAMDHLMKHSHVVYRIQEHQNSNQVTYETARTDLLNLVDLGLLEKHREGKAFVFHMPQNPDGGTNLFMHNTDEVLRLRTFPRKRLPP
jgi:Fic family protein